MTTITSIISNISPTATIRPEILLPPPYHRFLISNFQSSTSDHITSIIKMSFPPPTLAPLAAQVSTLLKARKETVCIAETAAGGLLSAVLLAQPGASAFYAGGATLYTLPSRIAFAGWTKESIANYNGPTPEIVAGLAENVRGTLGATWAVGESGTAGPTRSGEGRNRTP
jgi:PncC family amidohydrolase